MRYTGLVAIAAAAGTASGQIMLSDDTATAGLTATNMPDGATIPGPQEQQMGGLAVGDFNRDGCMDIFWIGGGLTPDRLFINDCNGTGHFTNQAAAWGVAVSHCGNGAAVGDYDADGLPDIYVTSFGPPGGAGPGHHKLYHNDGGSFSEVGGPAGVSQSCTLPSPPNPAGYGAAFGDYDLDGWLDLAVTSWWGNDDGNRLFHNNGDGTFTDVTVAMLGAAVNGEWGFQPAFVDMNGDRFPELLIASDFETSRYFVNAGGAVFVNYTVSSGTGLDDNGMGQAVADFNNDGNLDWYVTSIHKDNPNPGDYVGNMLYLGLGNHQYLEISNIAGVNNGGWGWGTAAIDFDQDTWTDLIEVNGRPGGGEWANERGYLWRNNGNLTFTEIGVAAGFNFPAEGRGLVYLDADQDGDLDVVVNHNAGPLKFYRNVSVTGHWLRVVLDSSADPRLAPDGFGARAVATVAGTGYVRYMSSSPSYLATSEPALHWGLGAATVVDELRIQWPQGAVTVLNDVAADQDLVITAPLPGDLDGDGDVDTVDFLALLAAWGPCPPGTAPCLADLNGNGTVDTVDFLTLLANWG